MCCLLRVSFRDIFGYWLSELSNSPHLPILIGPTPKIPKYGPKTVGYTQFGLLFFQTALPQDCPIKNLPCCHGNVLCRPQPIFERSLKRHVKEIDDSPLRENPKKTGRIVQASNRHQTEREMMYSWLSRTREIVVVVGRPLLWLGLVCFPTALLSNDRRICHDDQFHIDVFIMRTISFNVYVFFSAVHSFLERELCTYVLFRATLHSGGTFLHWQLWAHCRLSAPKLNMGFRRMTLARG